MRSLCLCKVRDHESNLIDRHNQISCNNPYDQLPYDRLRPFSTLGFPGGAGRYGTLPFNMAICTGELSNQYNRYDQISQRGEAKSDSHLQLEASLLVIVRGTVSM